MDTFYKKSSSQPFTEPYRDTKQTNTEMIQFDVVRPILKWVWWKVANHGEVVINLS